MSTIKDVVEKVQSHCKRPKAAKSNRTHALSEPNYRVFQQYCRSKGVYPSEVLDDLITMFLDEVKDDLPLDLDKVG